MEYFAFLFSCILAQERLVAKLVTAAREKLAAKDRDRLAAKDKDKQLQAERRKKAAEFINLLSKDPSNNQTKTSKGELIFLVILCFIIYIINSCGNTLSVSSQRTVFFFLLYSNIL